MLALGHNVLWVLELLGSGRTENKRKADDLEHDEIVLLHAYGSIITRKGKKGQTYMVSALNSYENPTTILTK